MDERLFEKPETLASVEGDGNAEEEGEILEEMINNLSFEVEGLDMEYIKNQPDIISSSVDGNYEATKDHAEGSEEKGGSGDIKLEENEREQCANDKNEAGKPIIIAETCDANIVVDKPEIPPPSSPDATGDMMSLKPETAPTNVRRKSVRFSESIDFPHRYDSCDEPASARSPEADELELSKLAELREIRLQKNYSLLLQDRYKAEQKLYDELEGYSSSTYTKIAIAVSIFAALIILIRYFTG